MSGLDRPPLPVTVVVAKRTLVDPAQPSWSARSSDQEPFPKTRHRPCRIRLSNSSRARLRIMQAPAHGTIAVIDREKRTRLNRLSHAHGERQRQ